MSFKHVCLISVCRSLSLAGSRQHTSCYFILEFLRIRGQKRSPILHPCGTDDTRVTTARALRHVHVGGRTAASPRRQSIPVSACDGGRASNLQDERENPPLVTHRRRLTAGDGSLGAPSHVRASQPTRGGPRRRASPPKPPTTRRGANDSRSEKKAPGRESKVGQGSSQGTHVSHHRSPSCLL